MSIIGKGGGEQRNTAVQKTGRNRRMGARKVRADALKHRRNRSTKANGKQFSKKKKQ